MSSLYLECNSGISGDMAVAALIDAGADVAALEQVLASIPVKGFKTQISRVTKSGVDCCDFNVILDQDNHDHDMEYLYGHLHQEDHSHQHEQVFHDGQEHLQEHSHQHEHSSDHEHEHPEYEHAHHDHDHEHPGHEHEHHHHHEHRNYQDIEKIIDGTTMPQKARSLAKEIFLTIARAEAKAHGKPLDQVHFHEVGALDSIVDVIALAVCFTSLDVQKVYIPRLCEGRGTVRCQHGILNIPVPAVSNIVAESGLNLSFIDAEGEFITPTGAAFAACVKTCDQLPQSFAIKKIGIGAGKRAYSRMNVVMAFVIEEATQNQNLPAESSLHSNSQGSRGFQDSSKDTIWKLETNIDDTTGENLGQVMELLFAAGARDVSYCPCFMKKNRPGWLLNVICTREKIQELEKIIFQNTTTIGIRRLELQRAVLDRRLEILNTKWGKVQLKVVDACGITKVYPEYEDIKTICAREGLSFQQVYSQVQAMGFEKFC